MIVSTMNTLCISGTRRANGQHKDLIIGVVDDFIRNNRISHIYVGDCVGVDKIINTHYSQTVIEVIEVPARWDLYGKSAGPIRNREMLNKSNFLLAFPDQDSRGTKSAIAIAKRLNIPVYIVEL